MYSIIVPVYNEVSTIDTLQENLSQFLGRAEVILVDGGSSDGTLEKYSDDFKVLKTQARCRARQMNLGVEAAQGNRLLFSHADSLLPQGALEQMDEVLEVSRIGTFGVKFDDESLLMRICGYLSNRRVIKRNIAFGDQGIFLSKEDFFTLGAFPDIPLMEDFQFSMTADAAGFRYKFTSDKIITSSRRFGTNSLHQLLLMWKMRDLRELYVRGVSAEEIIKDYKDIR